MAFDIVFPNPLVTDVLFQIRFPGLFFLERRIGDFQVKIMRQFPESQLLLHREMLIMVGEQEDASKLAEGVRPEEAKRVWRFRSQDGVLLDVTLNSLSLRSTVHKSYNSGGGPYFRDAIKSACDSFIDVMQLPTISRVGLRYIDRGPIPDSSNETFLSYYNSTFPLSRFPLDRAMEMLCQVAVRRDSYNLRYIETLQNDGGKMTLILDFDAWSENVDASEVMGVTDALHKATADEFQNTVKQPVIDYMKRPPEVSNE